MYILIKYEVNSYSFINLVYVKQKNKKIKYIIGMQKRLLRT